MEDKPFKFLLQGIDTLQVAYFLEVASDAALDFEFLAEKKEELRQAKRKEPCPVKIGNTEFLLQPYGTASGYSYVLTNEDFKIELGEFTKPNFFVTFYSQALWKESARFLHQKFLKWAASAGCKPYRKEAISRVDFAFDYYLPEIDFTQDSFKTRSAKDGQYREKKKVQTFCFGKGDIVLRVYDKVAEIRQQSNKVWFFLLWGRRTDVWRIEWQLRKSILKRFDIITLEDLEDQKGDLLRYLAEEHDTLRVPTNDSNASRWPLHPLWQDLQEQIANMNNLGVYRVLGQNAVLSERLERIGISIFGYLKRVAAIACIQNGEDMLTAEEAWQLLRPHFDQIYDPLSWQLDVRKRVDEMRLGQW